MENKTEKQKEKDLLLENKDMVIDNNIRMLNVVLGVCTGIFSALCLMSIFVSDYTQFTWVYAGTGIISFILLYTHNFLLKGKYVIPLIYLSFALYFLYSCYSSFILAPEYISVIVLLCQIVLPAIIVDKMRRITSSMMFFYFTYIIGVIIFKDTDLILDEIINITTFTMVGSILGYFIRKMKMDNFEYRRLASINEHMDFLTNLYNRKKMFSDIDKLNQGMYSSSAFFMIDVDHFKLYNDTFGHVSGDECLRKLGASMLTYANAHHLRIYRFGGEEFAAICFRDGLTSYVEVAEGLKQAICDMQIPHAYENSVVTISVGVCPFDVKLPFDEIIKRADDVLYEAKRTGRNKVVVYEEKMI